MPTATIEPNEKYQRVIGLPTYDGDDWEEWNEEEQQAADAYRETIDQAPTADDVDIDEDKTLSWNHFSVSSDPDLVSKMATYFDGVEPDEPTDLIRAKLRLLDCDVYAQAQIASRAEMREAPAA